MNRFEIIILYEVRINNFHHLPPFKNQRVLKEAPQFVHLSEIAVEERDNVETKDYIADDLAGEMLKYDDILRMGQPFTRYFSEKNLLAISAELNIDPAVVLGKLQHDKLVDYRNRLNRYKGKVRDLFKE